MLLAWPFEDGGLLMPQGEEWGNMSCRQEQRPCIARAAWWGKERQGWQQNPTAEFAWPTALKRLTSKVWSQDQFVGTALLSNTYKGKSTQVWGPRKSCNQLISCKKTGKDGVPVLAPCIRGASQHVSLCLQLCQPLESVPETPSMIGILTRATAKASAPVWASPQEKCGVKRSGTQMVLSIYCTANIQSPNIHPLQEYKQWAEKRESLQGNIRTSLCQEAYRHLTFLAMLPWTTPRL